MVLQVCTAMKEDDIVERLGPEANVESPRSNDSSKFLEDLQISSKTSPIDRRFINVHCKPLNKDDLWERNSGGSARDGVLRQRSEIDLESGPRTRWRSPFQTMYRPVGSLPERTSTQGSQYLREGRHSQITDEVVGEDDGLQSRMFQLWLDALLADVDEYVGVVVGEVDSRIIQAGTIRLPVRNRTITMDDLLLLLNGIYTHGICKNSHRIGIPTTARPSAINLVLRYIAERGVEYLTQCPSAPPASQLQQAHLNQLRLQDWYISTVVILESEDSLRVNPLTRLEHALRASGYALCSDLPWTQLRSELWILTDDEFQRLSKHSGRH